MNFVEALIFLIDSHLSHVNLFWYEYPKLTVLNKRRINSFGIFTIDVAAGLLGRAGMAGVDTSVPPHAK